MKCVLALDIGGTKIGAALVTPEGQMRSRTAIRWQPEQPADAWARLVQAASAARPQQSDCELVAVGVGVPAVLDVAAGVVLWAPNIPAWDHFPLAAKLREELGCPVWLGFDGHLATLGEHWLGAGRGVQDLALLAVGTGIGGGVISGGRLLQGVCGLAGAVGWMRVGLPPTARADSPLYPGWVEKSRQLGFLESLAAGPAILARANHLARAQAGQQPGRGTVRADDGAAGVYPDTPAVFAACRRGELPARQAVEEAAWALGVAAANLVNSVGCRRVIVGGGVGEQADLLLPRMRQVMAEYAQPWMAREAQIAAAELGNAAGLAGAARLAWEHAS